MDERLPRGVPGRNQRRLVFFGRLARGRAKSGGKPGKLQLCHVAG